MRLTALLPSLGLIASLAIVPGIGTEPATPQPTEDEEFRDDPYSGRYVYLRSGSPIAFQASPLYAAALLPESTEEKRSLTPPDGLELDPRGNRPDLIDRGVTLFRVPYSVAPRGLDTEPPPDAWQVTLRSGLPAQPVFEHGAALRIPSDEVVVGFDPATTLEEAKRLLSEIWDDLDSRGLREFRPGSFICPLRDASTGRAFKASRMLSRVEGVLWAEPSFINIYLETPGGPPVGRALPSVPSNLTHRQTLESRYLGRLVSSVDRNPEGFVWRSALDGHFENDIDLWTVARDDGSNRILPFVVREPTHDGKRAVYMSGKGLAGNRTSDPYREGASSYLISPVFDLADYPEAFVELWFWARFEDPVDAPRRVYDMGRVLLYDVESKEYVYEYPIAPVGPTGDLTRGPGTMSGWRKLMFRVPSERLPRPMQVLVHFYSDDMGEAEGMFVALLDDGVERDHPDLAFWKPDKGEESESGNDKELFPGDPVSPEDRHGTACAGLLGAVANNAIGIAGVAPGALLLPLHRGVDDLSIVRAIDAAVEYGAQVLVIPWGWTGAAPEVITHAIVDALDAGTAVVAAAGDGVHRPYSDAIDYPCVLGASTPLICVGASGIAGEPKGPASADGLYWWRSAVDETGPDLLAPGTWLHATDRRGLLGYNDGSREVLPDWTDEFAGTGASACYVGGVATLMATRDPLLVPEELKRLIMTSAMELPSSTARRSELRLVTPKAAVQAAIESAAARVQERDPEP